MILLKNNYLIGTDITYTCIKDALNSHIFSTDRRSSDVHHYAVVSGHNVLNSNHFYFFYIKTFKVKH